MVYSRNITPDPDTGIGRWTDEQIVNAVRRGERPDGSRVFPIHPDVFFAKIADDDARAPAAFLPSVKSVRSQVPAAVLNGPVPAIPVAAARRPRRRAESSVARIW